ncbi:unnamed protein product, partial [Adineta steineri]
IQLLVCGNNINHSIDNILSSSTTSTQISPLSSLLQMSQTVNDNMNETTVDLDFQGTVENLQFNTFVEQIKQLIFLCWAAAAGNIKLHGQNLTIKEEVKLDRYTLLQQINTNVINRNNSKNSLSNDSSADNNVQQTVQFGICVKKESILPLDSEIAEKIIEIITFCFEKRPEFIGKYEY